MNFCARSGSKSAAIYPKRCGISSRAVECSSLERYKNGAASLGKAAEIAGVPVGQMMTILTEFGVESRIEKEDYLQGLQNLAKIW